MIRKGVWLVAVALGALAVSQWQDIIRYTKIKQMSAGTGHPENVPAEGTTAYPQTPDRGAKDGTGDFDSARRGGPATRQPG
jgi:hypothetical protein